MSWIAREFQFSKSQAEREFNCPLYKSYIRAAKTAKGTKWQRDPRKKLLSKFSLVEDPCQRAFLFCNREKAKEFFEKDWAKRKAQREPAKRKSIAPKREMSPGLIDQADLNRSSTRKNLKGEIISTAGETLTPLNAQIAVGSSAIVRSFVQKPQAHQLLAPSVMSEATKQDKTKKIGVFIRGFK